MGSVHDTAFAASDGRAIVRAAKHVRHPRKSRKCFRYNVGRWEGSEAQWKERYAGLVGYLHDSLPRFDAIFNPNGGALNDDELGYWDPSRSPKYIKRDLRKLDLSGNLQRPLIIMHGTADATVSPGETAGYQTLVEQMLGGTQRRTCSPSITSPAWATAAPNTIR
jgi:hypothetical protein